MKDNVPSGTDRNKAVSDNPPMLDEILAIAPGLEANWPAEAAAIPPGTLVNRAEPGEPPAVLGGEGGEEGEPGGEPGGDPAGGTEEESFIDSFNLDEYDEAARPAIEKLQREWQGNYTRKRQADRAEVEEARREAEQYQALVDGLRDPSTLPHYLRLMGIDPADPTILEALGISGADGPNKELLDILDGDGDDPDDVQARIDKIERERAEEVQTKRASEMEEALDELADQQLEKIETEWGRELTEDEDFIIRSRAEAEPGPDGLPDYDSAAAKLKGFLGRREQDWAKERQESGNRNGAPGGRPGGKAPDLSTEEGRLEAAAAAAERAQASQQQ